MIITGLPSTTARGDRRTWCWPWTTAPSRTGARITASRVSFGQLLTVIIKITEVSWCRLIIVRNSPDANT